MAVHVLGDVLEFDLPVTALQTRLHDWVRCGGTVRHVGNCFLTKANWDTLVRPLEPSAVMREARYLHSSRLAYRDTAMYRRYLEMMTLGYRIRRNRAPVDSQERLDDYLDRFAALYRSIEQRGLMRMRDVRRAGADLPGSTAPRRTGRAGDDADIGVAIGPDGEMALLPGAKHRFAVARVLGLERVPVQVRMVHANWLRSLPAGSSHVDAITCAMAGLKPASHVPA